MTGNGFGRSATTAVKFLSLEKRLLGNGLNPAGAQGRISPFSLQVFTPLVPFHGFKIQVLHAVAHND